jgi:hypothetical protein
MIQPTARFHTGPQFQPHTHTDMKTSDQIMNTTCATIHVVLAGAGFTEDQIKEHIRHIVRNEPDHFVKIAETIHR